MTPIKKSLLFAFFLLCSISFAQEKYTISGIVTEEKSNESLIGVNIIVSGLHQGVSTNEYGFYSFSLPEGKHTLSISYLGFNTITREIDLHSDIRLNLQLSENSEQLDEVVVTEYISPENIGSPQMSVNELSINTIKKMPVVLGETDIIKSILLLPGVTSAGEAASGFNVRGGAADQNLILLDEATIYNSSHLYGFFSVFNPDAIKDIKLYKGGIPSRYGGRVSSVLDIFQKDGNSRNFHMNGGIGVLSSRLLAEGPIVKDKGSFLFAGRSSYAHLFLKLTDNENAAYFYDLNTKISYRFNDNNSIFISGYFGRDVVSIRNSFKNTYGNSILNFRWNHLFSDKLFSNLSFIYSDYYYGLRLNFVQFNWDSGIQNFNLKYDFKHYVNQDLKLYYGVNGAYYKFNPGEVTPTGENSGANYRKLDDKYALESAVYIDVEHSISDRLKLQYGLRASSFFRMGQKNLNLYKNNNPVIFNEDFGIYEKAVPTGTLTRSRTKRLKTFINLEPRASLAYKLSENTSLKVSYNRMAQYLHLISNTSSPTPLDVWAPSGRYIKPQLLDQYALGYFHDFRDNSYTLEAEGFYKNIKNRIDYIDGADLIANNAIEQVILPGEARAYGLELLLRKKKGRLQGWLSYTLSHSEQRTPPRTIRETGINNGEWYNTPYNKTHDISLTGSYAFNKKLTMGMNFIAQSGQPVTYPDGYYQYQGVNFPSYTGRNDENLPAYHRLDLSLTYTPKPEKKKGWQSEWVFGIYNLYNRKNAASITFRQDRETARNEAVRLSIFGIVPSISYNFKF
ncbi:TonB-dependent receptor [Sinomicrobium weinanense]|uniref:isocitrate dehydrogenase (NADP(+)) n=1 Tax=Sinomicrobium weinanense TaxID=2842200 RepID=A0A926JQ72_9FLAO|nr:TonB-dependent receptor [Sinomicrobium weinanense]MBC9795346.1 TonB-dependent receptor [Sinomicrobium weinanense]MBU3122939.1 TonB-dependent receptor [Sinomicrobium weinanense]